MILTAILLLLSTMNFCLCNQQETVTVKINQGELRGNVATTVNGFKYYSFQGIPYAKPPVGSLRFKNPQPADPWDGICDALEAGSICVQYFNGRSGNEDCLFVNVATPALPGNESAELKPVMVNIHGGGFTQGLGSLAWNDPDFFLEADVLFVSLNYCLAGFAVGHGDDMDYYYYISGLQYDSNSMEYTTLQRIVRMWTNFARTGNPTPQKDSLLQNVTWSPVTALDDFYLDIGKDLIVKRNLENERLSFWEDINTGISDEFCFSENLKC